jgi:hypothetical protein
MSKINPIILRFSNTEITAWYFPPCNTWGYVVFSESSYTCFLKIFITFPKTNVKAKHSLLTATPHIINTWGYFVPFSESSYTCTSSKYLWPLRRPMWKQKTAYSSDMRELKVHIKCGENICWLLANNFHAQIVYKHQTGHRTLMLYYLV